MYPRLMFSLLKMKTVNLQISPLTVEIAISSMNHQIMSFVNTVAGSRNQSTA